MSFTVSICTRDRPRILAETIAALDAQTLRDFEVLVVDDSSEADPALDARAASDPRFRVVREGCPGLSRARNLGWQLARTEWVVYLDDDCIPEPDWAAQLARTIDEHPGVWFVGAFVGARNVPTGDYVIVTVHEIEREEVLSGRWTRPWDIGFTICMAARRSTLEDLGGFDERLGPGVRDFPSAEDMDLNYRLLKAGGSALEAPNVRAWHDQWRPLRELGPHFRGYMAGWSGFSMKHLRSGDVVGGLWLWQWGLRDTLRMFGSAAKRRSRLRLRIALYKLHGLVRGTWRGLTRRW